MEPFYIRQRGDSYFGMDVVEVRRWFRECASEARGEGAQLCRFSIHPENGWLLVEAWREKASQVVDQGEPRWQVMAAA